MATDFGGKGSRRTFAERLLREVESRFTASAGVGVSTTTSTVGTIPKWIASSVLGNSIITESAGVITVGGGLTTSGTANLAQSATSSTVTIGTGTQSSFATVAVRSAAGQQNYLAWQRGTLDRFRVGVDTAAETGSDAGSDFFIAARTDAGSFIDIPISITRASGGSITIRRLLAIVSGGLSVTPANASVTLSPTGTGTVTVNPATAGTINNVSIGATTQASGRFTTLRSSSTNTLDALAGVGTRMVTADATGVLGVQAIPVGLTDGDKGDITVSGSGATWTIDNGVVSYAKIQDVAANRFLANITGSPAVVQEVATDRIPLFSSAITGTPSASTYLRGDGSWATVSGTGDVVGPASATDNAIVRFDSTTGKLVQNSVVTIGDTGNVSGVVDLTTTGNTTLGNSATADSHTINGPTTVTSLLTTTPAITGKNGTAFANGDAAAFLHSNGPGLTIEVPFASGEMKFKTTNVTFLSVSTGMAIAATNTVGDAALLVTGVSGTNNRLLRLRKDTSNYLDIEISTTGVATYRLTGSVADLHSFDEAINTDIEYRVSGTKVVGAQGATISDPTGGTVQDSEARTAINTIIDRLQAHGLIA